MGREFVVTYMPNRFARNSTLEITIVSPQLANVQITYGSINKNITVTPDNPHREEINLRSGFDHSFGEVVKKENAIFITSNVDIGVSALNLESVSSDGTLYLPVQTLGTKYTINLIDVNSGTETSRRYYFKLISPYDNNQITIKTSYRDTDNRLSPNTNNQITLNRGESIIHSFRQGNNPSGSEIISTSPLCVLSGTSWTVLPSNADYPDHTYHIEYPDDFNDTEYVIVPTSGRTNNPDYINILSLVNNNGIRFNGSLVQTLQKGEDFPRQISTPTIVETDGLVSIAQYAGSGRTVLGDPFKLQLIPTKQMCDDISYTLIPSSNIRDNFKATIIKHFGDQCFIDGIPENGFTRIGTSEYDYKHIPQDPGTYTVSTSEGAMVLAYGWGSNDSYGYMAGGCFRRLEPEIFLSDSLEKRIICFDEDIELRAIEPKATEFVWTLNDSITFNGDSIVVTEPRYAGNYEFRLVLDGETDQTVFYEIERLAPVEIQLEDELDYCTDQIINLEATATGGGQEHNYMWTPTRLFVDAFTSRPRFKNLIDTVQKVYVEVTTEHGCIGIDSITLNPVLLDEPAAPDSVFICREDNLSNFINYAGTYRYYDVGDDDYYFEGTSAEEQYRDTAIVVLERERNGCFFYDTTYVEVLPTPVIDTRDIPIAACPGNWRDYVLPNVPNVVVDWQIENGEILTADGSDSFDVAAGTIDNSYNARILWPNPGDGKITFSIIDTVTGCVNVQEEIIPINNLLNPTIKADGILVYDTVEVCAGESVVLDAGVDFDDYNWYLDVLDQGNPFSKERSITVSESRRYIVNVFNELSCVGIDSIFLKVNPLPPVDAGRDTAICLGTPLVLNASGAVDYIWLDENDDIISDEATFELIISEPRELVLIGTDANGCVDSDTINIDSFDDDEIIIADNYLVCEGDNLAFTSNDYRIETQSGIVSYSWTSLNSNNDIQNPDSEFPTFIVNEEGTYRLDIVNGNGCSFFAEFDILIQSIEVDINFPDEICAGQDLFLNPVPRISRLLTPKESFTLMMDISSSMSGINLYLAREGSKSFINRLDPLYTELSLVSFDSYVYLDNPFTNQFGDVNSSLDALSAQSTTDYATALLTENISGLPYTDLNGQYSRKTIILVTDGGDNLDPDEVIAFAQANNITIHTVLLGGLQDVGLARISEGTGGLHFNDVEDLNSAIEAFGQIYRNYFPDPLEFSWSTNAFNLETTMEGGAVISGIDESAQEFTLSYSLRDTVTGCFLDTTHTITVNPRPVFDVAPEDVYCYGDTAYFRVDIDSVFDNYQIEWIPGEANSFIVNDQDSSQLELILETGNLFTVRVTNERGCITEKNYQFDYPRSNYSVAVGEIIAEPQALGERIPIELTVNEDNCPKDETIAFKLLVSMKIFNPQEIEIGGTTREITKTLVDSTREWLIEFELTDEEFASGGLFLIGDMILADQYSYPVSVGEVTSLQGYTDIESTDGSVTLTEICEEGEARFLSFDNFFNITSVYPNPFQREVKIEIETSHTDTSGIRVEVFDYIGQSVGVDFDVSIVSAMGHVNTMLIEIDGAQLENGIFNIIVRNNGKVVASKVVKQ
ncbi:MAG: hypothetical protein Kapaf2KO_23440 [Candidatus Kapaibacteriales bacterium]